MLNLALTTDKISLITSAAKTIDVHASFVDDASDVFTPGKQNTAITTATTTDIVAVPGASTVRNVKFISIRNKDAASCDVTVQYNANGTLYQLFKCTLATMEELVCREGVWFHFDASGGVYSTQLPVGSDSVVGGVQFASAADHVTGTEVTKVAVPGRLYLHPSAPKKWVSCGVAADIQESYGVSSLTDGGTGLLTVNFTANFAAATYCVQCTVEMTAATYAVANTRHAAIQQSTRAVGSVGLLCIDGTATTHLVKDPTTWHVVLFGALA